MTVLQKAADVAQKGAVLGLMTFFGFQVYQIATKTYEGVDRSKLQSPPSNPTTEYVEEIRNKAAEDYKNYWKVDHRDWYDKEDDSHLKNVPRPNRPPPKQEQK
jgi:hypothetical protein